MITFWITFTVVLNSKANVSVGLVIFLKQKNSLNVKKKNGKTSQKGKERPNTQIVIMGPRSSYETSGEKKTTKTDRAVSHVFAECSAAS